MPSWRWKMLHEGRRLFRDKASCFNSLKSPIIAKEIRESTHMQLHMECNPGLLWWCLYKEPTHMQLHRECNPGLLRWCLYKDTQPGFRRLHHPHRGCKGTNGNAGLGASHRRV